MASPRSPAPDAASDLATPQTTKRRYDQYEVRAYTTESNTPGDDSPASSPFVSCVNDTNTHDQENVSPPKMARTSRVLSGNELSPLKILSEQRISSADNIANAENMMPPPPPEAKSPRKVSPEKRFPVKPSEPTSTSKTTEERSISLQQAVTENEGLKHAIEIFEDDQSMVDNEADVTSVTNGGDQMDEDEAAGPDDTMVSTFSTFSAVPSMTMFARLGQSPTKAGGMTPRGRPDPSPSRTPRPNSSMQEPGSGNTTNLLMDFTEQMRNPQKSPSKRGHLTSSRTTPNVAATPNRHFSNLIDFDIPPMPTPRSIPSITARELESLKSNFLSEISSLKASLSGKEAEVQSLKTAVGDAEKRVGESMEQLREERSAKEQLAADKEGWENRGREMEKVLRKVKDEIGHSQREREELERKLDESEKRREAAEMMAQEAESKMAGLRAGKDSPSPDKPKSPGSNREVEVAVERVARDLHALYKSKHETKVAALKKSYESRWEKKVRELEARIEELVEDNERMRLGRDATMTRVDPADVEERKKQAVKDSAAIRELTADIQRLEAVTSSVQRDNESLRGMLERERVEKGELVQLAEEMMSMQSFVGARPQQEEETDRAEAVAKTPRASATTVENLRSSIGRGSGLRAPGSGLRAPQDRYKAGGLPRPGARSGIMSSIEKMGSYRGRGE